MIADKPTRVAVDLLESAAVEGVRQRELDASIQERARSISFGARLAAQGGTAVALDDAGNLIEHRPDGTRVPIG